MRHRRGNHRADGASVSDPVLTVRDLEAGYGSVRILEVPVITAHRGRVTAVVGSNGAGKSTLLRAISGLATVFGGSMSFQGADLVAMPPHERVRAGVVHVPEGRRLFHRQTVEDNLRLGLFGVDLDRIEADVRVEEAFELFPMLRERPHAPAGSLSGGQQQMLALARAFVRRPRLLLVDEPSLGLAPVVVDQVFEHLDRMRRGDVAIVLVEQLVERALALADDAYVLQVGRVVASGSTPELMDRVTLQHAYLGAASWRST